MVQLEVGVCFLHVLGHIKATGTINSFLNRKKYQKFIENYGNSVLLFKLVQTIEKF